MAIIKWNPYWPDWFDEDMRFPTQMASFTPAVDIYEDKDNVVVEAPLAGIDPAKVNIEIEDNVLKISGKSEKKTEVDEKNFYRKEIRSGSFYRVVALPKAVNGSKAVATFDKGILKITIPKKEEAKPKKVTIKPTAK